MAHLELNILLAPNDLGGYTAQVIERDLAADGRDLDGALHELARVLNVHCAACHKLGLQPLTCLDEGPVEARERLKDATRLPKTLPDLSPIACAALGLSAQVMVV